MQSPILPPRPTTPSPRDPTIRHAGRAHIRGRIRRVWRPRYLELCDSGLMRYYELPATADVTLPEDSDWDHVNMIPKDSLVIYHARIIDVTTLRDLHVGLPKGSFGFLFRGQRQMTHELMTNPEPNPPREYFCAVSTLEEAQTWVIVLQWAATVSKNQRRDHLLLSDCSIPSPSAIPNLDASDPIEDRLDRQSTLTSATSEIDTTDSAPTESNPTTKETVPRSPEPKRNKSRIVVTKVHGYRLLRLDTPSWEWEIGYEIALLLLKVPNVEERRILRQPAQLSCLLQELDAELESTTSLTVIDEWRSKIRLGLPSLRSNAQTSVTPQAVELSFTLVDGMLRALAMDADIVNSNAMRRFLVLETDRPPLVPHVWYQNRTTQSILHRQTRTISEEETDDFVKKWLAGSQATPSEQPTVLWLVQQSWQLWGGGLVAVMFSLPFFRLYQRFMISLTIRLDVLLLTWCLAAYVGKASAPQPRRTTHRVAITTPKRDKATVAKEPSSQIEDASSVDSREDVDYEEEEQIPVVLESKLSSPLPQYPNNNGESCWSIPPDNRIFRVRGPTYLEDRIKIPSGPSPFSCRGVDIWLTDNAERHIARHPSVLAGKLHEQDTFLVNFLLPFANLVAYFTVPPLSEFPDNLADVWTKFVKGDQQYRDQHLKLLPVVIDGPWIVKAAVGNGTAPAMLGKVIPLQYFFREPEGDKKGVYEVDVIITASSIAKGILSVVKGHTKMLTIAFAFIIEGAKPEELPETVLCGFQIHSLRLEDCPHLPECNLDEI